LFVLQSVLSSTQGVRLLPVSNCPCAKKLGLYLDKCKGWYVRKRTGEEERVGAV